MSLQGGLEASADDEASEPKEGAGLGSLIKNSKVTSASVQGEVVISRADGMLFSRTSQRSVAAEIPNPFGKVKIPNVITQETENQQLPSRLDLKLICFSLMMPLVGGCQRGSPPSVGAHPRARRIDATGAVRHCSEPFRWP